VLDRAVMKKEGDNGGEFEWRGEQAVGALTPVATNSECRRSSRRGKTEDAR
jgi:hypothetical protein